MFFLKVEGREAIIYLSNLFNLYKDMFLNKVKSPLPNSIPQVNPRMKQSGACGITVIVTRNEPGDPRAACISHPYGKGMNPTILPSSKYV